MSTVHLILQGKGGVGKSLAAFLLAQYLPEKSINVRCYDADPVNSTLASFPALNAVKVDLMESLDKARRINPRRFDDLVEQIARPAGRCARHRGHRIEFICPPAPLRCHQRSTVDTLSRWSRAGGPHRCYRRPIIGRYAYRRGPTRQATGRRTLRDLAQSILGTGRSRWENI